MYLLCKVSITLGTAVKEVNFQEMSQSRLLRSGHGYSKINKLMKIL